MCEGGSIKCFELRMWDMESSSSNKLEIPIHKPYISELLSFLW